MEKKNRLTVGLFVIYLVLLSWIVVFKMSFSITDLGHFRNINLVPFRESVIVNGKLQLSEIILNILAFVPLGIYLSMLEPGESFIRKVVPVFFISLTYEAMQYVLAVGASDITDLISNTLGGVIGAGVYLGLEKVWKKKTNSVLNVLALCGTVLLVLLVGALVIVNM